MAETYSTDTRDYITNDYKAKKLQDEKILITTSHGGWVFLNEREYMLLRNGNVEMDPALYNILVQEGIISTDSNLFLTISQSRQKYCHLLDSTSLHIVTPTIRCNHDCSYCYASAKPPEDKEYDMDEPTAKSVVDFIFQSKTKDITIEFQGGEPLLNFPIITYILEYAKEKNKASNKNLTFRLVTNLTLMTEDKLDWLIENNVVINSSLDGPKNVHNKNRHYCSGIGSYDDVVFWMKKIRERGIDISMMPTATRFSLPYWKEMVDEYVSLGMMRFWARRLNYAGMAYERWEQLGYSAEEYIDFWKKCVDYIFELNKKGVNIREGYVEILVKNIILSKSYSFFVCLSSPCGCAWSQLSYNYKGDIYACDEARSFEIFRLGNVKETTYKDLFSSWKVLDILDLTSGLSFDCSSCVYHPFCGPCIVDEYGEHGNIIKRPNSFNCKVKKAMMEYVFKHVILDKERFEIAKKWAGLEGKTWYDTEKFKKGVCASQ